MSINILSYYSLERLCSDTKTPHKGSLGIQLYSDTLHLDKSELLIRELKLNLSTHNFAVNRVSARALNSQTL